jgi:LEA14-like dessication related protein
VFRVKTMKDRLDFDVSFDKLQLNTIKLSDVVKGDGYFRLLLDITVWNKDSITIPVSNLDIRLYYNDVEIGKNSALKGKKIKIQPNAKQVFREAIDIQMGKDFADLIQKYLTKQNPELQYNIGVNVFAIPINYVNTIKLNTLN